MISIDVAAERFEKPGYADVIGRESIVAIERNQTGEYDFTYEGNLGGAFPASLKVEGAVGITKTGNIVNMALSYDGRHLSNVSGFFGTVPLVSSLEILAEPMTWVSVFVQLRA